MVYNKVICNLINLVISNNLLSIRDYIDIYEPIGSIVGENVGEKVGELVGSIIPSESYPPLSSSCTNIVVNTQIYPIYPIQRNHPIHLSNLNIVHHIIIHNTTINPPAAAINSANVNVASSDPKKIDISLPRAAFDIEPNKNPNPTHKLTSNILEPNAFATAISIFICLATITDDIQSGKLEPTANNVIPNKSPGISKHCPILTEPSTVHYYIKAMYDHVTIYIIHKHLGVVGHYILHIIALHTDEEC